MHGNRSDLENERIQGLQRLHLTPLSEAPRSTKYISLANRVRA
jgi:hypothetical protein